MITIRSLRPDDPTDPRLEALVRESDTEPEPPAEPERFIDRTAERDVPEARDLLFDED
ncbi:MAG: hypothetical protein O3A57_11175 [Bacteroidetes bacterium]|nr:hypothetical protein [Bacteroidota bacterium]